MKTLNETQMRYSFHARYTFRCHCRKVAEFCPIGADIFSGFSGQVSKRSGNSGGGEVAAILSRVLESGNCHLIGSYYWHLRLVVLESFSNFQTCLSHAGKKPVLTCHLAILKNTT